MRVNGGVKTLLHQFPLDGLIIGMFGEIIVFPWVVVEVKVL